MRAYEHTLPYADVIRCSVTALLLTKICCDNISIYILLFYFKFKSTVWNNNLISRSIISRLVYRMTRCISDNGACEFSLYVYQLGQEKLIFCFSGTAAFVFRPPVQIFITERYPYVSQIDLASDTAESFLIVARVCYRFD